MSVKVYIDGQEGTTGLKILERFKDRNDIEIMKIDEDRQIYKRVKTVLYILFNIVSRNDYG